MMGNIGRGICEIVGSFKQARSKLTYLQVLRCNKSVSILYLFYNSIFYPVPHLHRMSVYISHSAEETKPARLGTYLSISPTALSHPQSQSSVRPFVPRDMYASAYTTNNLLLSPICLIQPQDRVVRSYYPLPPPLNLYTASTP
ncbi:hypothetical protein HZ326_21056 [Fusarium oxysporum f. sp. albedinis]|nr:hypothetical protein HZ326_21056 [Fusarium oxysporum f. sp. albedinis]